MLYTIDIGTSSFKSSIWDFEGNRIAFAAIPLAMSLNDGLRHETDSAQWLRAFEDSCRRLGAEAPLTAVKALVISGNGPSLTPVLKSEGGVAGVNPRRGGERKTAIGGLERGGRLPPPFPLSTVPARLWLDRRAAKAAEQVSALMGGFVDASFFLPKALDIKTNEPQLYEQTKYFLGCPELLAFALTGEARTVFPSDGFERWFWNDSILDRLDLDREKFPPFIRPGETFGGLAPQCAVRFGMKPDIPVISGGPDFFAAILGSGVIQPGQVCDRAGTSEGINACTKTRITDERLMSYSHPVKPFFNLSGIVSTTGKAIEWARDLLGIPTPDDCLRRVHTEGMNPETNTLPKQPYPVRSAAGLVDFCALAQTAQPGSGGLVFVPYLAGERAPIWNPSARATLRGITLSTRRAEFARSVLEGICFAIRDVITIMEESGAVVNELRIAGAMSGNDILNQIKADITQKRILVTQHKETEQLGLAIIGSHALGKFATFAEAAARLVRIEKTFHPDGKNAALYDDLFGEYRRMREMG